MVILGQDVIVNIEFGHILLKHLEGRSSINNWNIQMEQTASCMSREPLSYGMSYVLIIVIDVRQDRQTPFVLLCVCVCVCVCVNICVRILFWTL